MGRNFDFKLNKEDIQAAFKAWFIEHKETPSEFLELKVDFTSEDSADKYATGATEDFLKYIKQIKGE